MEEDKKFQLDYRGSPIRVEWHSIKGQTIFRILFPDQRKPLVITRTHNPDTAKFWTSVPEGRQKEAEEIGSLITAHLQKK